MEQQYAITKIDSNEQMSVHLWKIGEPLSLPLWVAPRGHTRPTTPEYPALAEFPRTILAVDNRLFLGLSSGSIEEIDMESTERVARYGPRLMIDHTGTPQVGNIRGLVNLEGKIFDAGAAGLFETQSGKQLDDRRIGSVEVLNTSICVVPHGMNAKQQSHREQESVTAYDGRTGQGTVYTDALIIEFVFGRTREANVGDLVAMPGNEVVMEGVEPFDGSGGSPGRHITANGKVYTHHGNWPAERITIRDLATRETVSEIPLMTSEGFAIHEGRVYDMRMCPGDGKRKRITRVMSSDKDQATPNDVLFEEPVGEQITSIASAGVGGLLVALFNSGRTRVVYHQFPSVP